MVCPLRLFQYISFARPIVVVCRPKGEILVAGRVLVRVHFILTLEKLQWIGATHLSKHLVGSKTFCCARERGTNNTV